MFSPLSSPSAPTSPHGTASPEKRRTKSPGGFAAARRQRQLEQEAAAEEARLAAERAKEQAAVTLTLLSHAVERRAVVIQVRLIYAPI